MAARNNFKSGSCEMLILHILDTNGDCYAYQISQLIKELSKGIISFPEGSLYPAVYRLINNGFISDYKKQSGKRLIRVYYHLEPKGKERLTELLDEYYQTIQGIEGILHHEYLYKRTVLNYDKGIKKIL